MSRVPTSLEGRKTDGVLRNGEHGVDILHETIVAFSTPSCTEDSRNVPVPKQPDAASEAKVQAGQCSNAVSGSSFRLTEVEAYTLLSAFLLS